MTELLPWRLLLAAGAMTHAKKARTSRASEPSIPTPSHASLCSPEDGQLQAVPSHADHASTAGAPHKHAHMLNRCLAALQGL